MCVCANVCVLLWFVGFTVSKADVICPRQRGHTLRSPPISQAPSLLLNAFISIYVFVINVAITIIIVMINTITIIIIVISIIYILMYFQENFECNISQMKAAEDKNHS